MAVNILVFCSLLIFGFGIVLGMVLGLEPESKSEFNLVYIRQALQGFGYLLILGAITGITLRLSFNTDIGRSIGLGTSLAFIFAIGLYMGTIIEHRLGAQKGKKTSNIKGISLLFFFLHEEQRRHLIDFRQQWWSETRSLRKYQRRWIIFWKTRWFEVQILWSMGLIKLQEMLGMHRLP